MRFSDKLKNLRAEHHLSQVAFAKRIGVSKSLVAFWEVNKRDPRLEQIMKIGKMFNIDWTTLLDDELLNFSPTTKRDEEQTLLNSFHSLNDEGKKMLLTFAQSLVYNPLYGNGEGSIKDAFLYDGAKDQKALEDLTENEKVTLASHPSTKEKK